MAAPTDRRYTESHEWHLLEGDTLTVGITQFAADQLNDVTFVDMKGAGDQVEAGGSVGEVESVKTTSDIYSAVGGEIIEANAALGDDPSLVNSDPYGAGWLVKLRVAGDADLSGLMDAAAYDEAHGG